MNFDISHLLDQWDYQPGEVAVRKFKGSDGAEKIQLRVDLGLLQMNTSGRPDGKRPFGRESLFDHFLARLEKQRRANAGPSEAFVLKAEDCAKLQQEAIQYHHRYICLFQLEDYDAVIRDTNRNAAVFDFVDEYAETDELGWSLQQFRPQLLMMQIRARGMQALRNACIPRARICIINNWGRNCWRDQASSSDSAYSSTKSNTAALRLVSRITDSK